MGHARRQREVVSISVIAAVIPATAQAADIFMFIIS
jgi:hypothetical protein